MFKKIKKNNRGETAFLFVIIMMMCIYLFAFAVDFLEVGWQRYTLVRHVNYVARVAGRQGGFLSKDPKGRWDLNVPYITRQEMYSNSARVFQTAKIDKWDIVLKQSPSSRGTNLHRDFQVDYKKDIIVQGTITYNWTFLDRVLPFNAGDKQYSVSKRVTSERFIRSITGVEQ